jgi:excinuclease ABC subunit A
MEQILITGARQHNLKNVSLALPHRKLIVITGVSGSGKSSLAFDTLFAEGQRRYLEALSTQARQYLQNLDRPLVTSIEGLCPAIAIEQKPLTGNPRSTVGTITEIHDFLRVLYARLGKVSCATCGRLIRSHTIPEMVDEVLAWPDGSRLLILAPLGSVSAGRLPRMIMELVRDGFVRVRIDGRVAALEEVRTLPRQSSYQVDVVVDRLVLNHERTQRLAESLETAAHRSDGWVTVLQDGGDERRFTEKFRCVECGEEATAPNLSLFSFNHPAGACPECKGLGFLSEDADPAGASDREVEDQGRGPTAPPGWIPQGAVPCPACRGARLNSRARAVILDGLAIHQLSALSVIKLQNWVSNLELAGPRQQIGSSVLEEINRRLKTLMELGLSYLSLDRPANSLSGGEAQRIRLTHQISTFLSGVLYVLDEPSIGLHARDHVRLLEILKRLRDAGNTVVIVEHDLATIREADYVVDMGPGAGEQGGEVLYAGPTSGILQHPTSLTGQYLSGGLHLPTSSRRSAADGASLRLVGARGHNLKNVTVDFPIGCITCVTGVSGSGKSSLVLRTLYAGLAQRLYRAAVAPLPHEGIEGVDSLQRIAHVDQSLLDRTPRSNPATYTGIFTLVRQLFAQIPEARARGYRSSRFSFNIKGGRCEVCKGNGTHQLDMHFLPSVSVTCPACHGTRFRRETLEVHFKGKSIADVLNLTVQQALDFFENIPEIQRRLAVLQEVGLGYLRLGQPATEMSGGETQRIKLARELARRESGGTLFVLDEPTTGLHVADISRLLHVLRRLVERGNTIIVIEHHLEVIKAADHVIDMGPEGGNEGGRVVACGTPEQIADSPLSVTGRCLRPYLQFAGIG